ncbi:MAG: hypothetical protein IKU34_08550 [Clostridia bacterium]|nr:hypothetical protein [Clostridia bacterium]
MTNDILFTCVGTTDPVRGFRDGGMLHIMRHYRPQKVCIFLSKEMADFERADQRFTKTFKYVCEHWENYAPQMVTHDSEIVNAADLDAVYDPLFSFFRQTVQENPGSRILINLSSGTPQMKIILAQLSLSPQYQTLGIQVLNPEKRSGSSERANHKDYIIEDELELNEDNEPDSPCRCTEPRMLAMQRNMQRTRIRSLLEQRDYRALSAMRIDLPAEIVPLVNHLAARNDLKSEEAKKLARGLSLPFALYPAKRATDEQYKQLSEYHLLLRNLQLTKRYTEFVLRINPFLTYLTIQMLQKSLPCPLSGIIEPRRDDRIRLDPVAMARILPAEKAALETRLNEMIRPNTDISLHVLVPFLRVLGKLPDSTLNVLEACVRLNRAQRNPAAHQLHAITEERIQADCVDDNGRHYGAADLVRAFGRMLRETYPDWCDEALFTIYDRCNEYIISLL